MLATHVTIQIHTLMFTIVRHLLYASIRELYHQRRRRQRERHKFANLVGKNNRFARPARAFFIFANSLPSSGKTTT